MTRSRGLRVFLPLMAWSLTAASPARQEPDGRILAPFNGCSAVGAWNVSKVPGRPSAVRFELLVGSNLSANVFELDCSDLSLTQVGLKGYDARGDLGFHREMRNDVDGAVLRPVLEQVCRLSRGEPVPTYGDFASVAEFRRKAEDMDPAYFDGQPVCIYSGPPTITRPGG